MKALLVIAIAVASVLRVFAASQIDVIEGLVANGKADEALPIIERELAKHPRNPRLLYNYGVASYAAKRYDDALLAFDKVEALGNSSLAAKARAQKGNAEFHVGLNAKGENLDETIERWKTSLGHYRSVLKKSQGDTLAKNNHDIVQKLLLEILLKQAQTNLASALKDNWTERRIEQLRTALEKFQEARQVDDQSQEAKQGEQKAREELARSLAKEGEKKATPRDQQPLAQQVTEIEKGVEMLEDANHLLPDDKPIQEQLEKAQETLAKALVEKARQEIQQARDSDWDRAKFEKLESAIDHAQQAQELDKKNEEAPKVEQQAKDELAQVHEEKGDEMARRSERASLEYQAEWLTDALEHYEQAEELKPEDQPLAAKADQTQARLEEALQKLADKLMKDPPKPEQLEQTAARLEGAESALEQLEDLKPTPKTEQQLDEVQKRLADIRNKLAEEARQQLAREEAERLKNQQKPQQPQQQAKAPAEEPPALERPPEPRQPDQGKGADPKKGKDY